MRIALDPILMIVPFLLTGIWAALYSNRRVRVDVYHHSAEKQTTEAITARPAQFVVVDDALTVRREVNGVTRG